MTGNGVLLFAGQFCHMHKQVLVHLLAKKRDCMPSCTGFHDKLLDTDKFQTNCAFHVVEIDKRNPLQTSRNFVSKVE